MGQSDRDYYAEERRAFQELEAYILPWHAVVELAERCRRELGESPVMYILRPQDKGYHRANRSSRTIEFTGGTNALDVIHEMAHMLFDEHAKDHAFVVSYLVAMVKDHYLATPLTLTTQ